MLTSDWGAGAGVVGWVDRGEKGDGLTGAAPFVAVCQSYHALHLDLGRHVLLKRVKGRVARVGKV